VENIRHVFWMRDLTTGRIIYASTAYEDISGRSVQSLYDDPTSFRAMIHPDDAPHVARALDALYEQGTPLEAEMRIVATSGEVRWVGARAFRLPAADSLPERTVGFLEDITASKTASLALQESERLFRALFMDSSVIMLLLAPDTGRIVEANHSASAYYG
jgi:PAS domain S-box-containing protein